MKSRKTQQRQNNAHLLKISAKTKYHHTYIHNINNHNQALQIYKMSSSSSLFLKELTDFDNTLWRLIPCFYSTKSEEVASVGTIFNISLFTHTCYPKSECESRPLDLSHIPICVPCELEPEIVNFFLRFLCMTFLLDLE